MQVVCTDGTTFTCEAYELTDYGVTVYSHPHEPDEDRYAKTPDQMAYVPHDRLCTSCPTAWRPGAPRRPSAGPPTTLRRHRIRRRAPRSIEPTASVPPTLRGASRADAADRQTTCAAAGR